MRLIGDYVYEESRRKVRRGLNRYRLRLLTGLLSFGLGFLLGAALDGQVDKPPTAHAQVFAPLAEPYAHVPDVTPTLPILQPAVWPPGHPGRNADQLVMIAISRYDPRLGGTNCFNWSVAEQRCLSRTASGEDWEDKYGEIAACVPEWPIGTIFELDGTFWRCSDRGGKIVRRPDGAYWVDLLLDWSPYYYGQKQLASVWFPE